MRHILNLTDLFDLFGAEDPEGAGTPPAGTEGTTEGSSPTPPPAPQEGDADDSTDDQTYSGSYVRTLRSEAAQNRVKAKELTEKLAAYEKAEADKAKAEMDAVERAKVEVSERDEKINALESSLTAERVENAVYRVASDLNFVDPGDALSFLNDTDIDFDDGKPTDKSIRKALGEIAKAKPYLLRPTGSGDGGTRGKTPNPASPEEKQKAYLQQYQNKGRMVVPQ